MKILTVILLLICSQSFAQSKGFMMKGDTLLYVRDIGDTIQINRNIPPMLGQAGKVLSNNGAAYVWQPDATGGGATFLNLANAFSSTSTTPAAVTGWSFPVTSGVTYRIEVIGSHQTAATTTGGIIGISLTGATGTVRGFAKGSISAAAVATELAIPIRATSGAGSTLTTTAVSAINTPHFIHLLITFTCTGNGTFNIVWGSEVNGSAAQLNQNSTLTYQALN